MLFIFVSLVFVYARDDIGRYEERKGHGNHARTVPGICRGSWVAIRTISTVYMYFSKRHNNFNGETYFIRSRFNRDAFTRASVISLKSRKLISGATHRGIATSHKRYKIVRKELLSAKNLLRLEYFYHRDDLLQ